jgi:L-lactate dehydrogenase complex protein LldG
MSVISSREAVLGRIRAATRNSATTAEQAAGAYAMLPREYVRRGSMSAEALLKRMAERLREYDAEVVECGPEELGATIAAQLQSSGRHIFVAPPGVPSAWLVPAAWQIKGFEWNIDHGLSAGEIERAEGVVTASFCGVAESGTIVLHHSETEGRRVITLLPDWHLCVLRASQIVETLPEYFDRCEVRERGSKGAREQEAREQETEEPPRLVTWISGPSATADIEMTRIKGVHGPRFLHVILVRDQG